MICIFSSNFLYIPRAHALSDSRQFVLDAWTLVNEGYYDPDRLDEIQWKRIRQKTLQKQIETSVEAYSACLLYTSPSPRDRTRSRMPSSA